MPGVHLLLGSVGCKTIPLDRVLEDLREDSFLRVVSIKEEPEFRLWLSGHDSYPHRVFTHDGLFFLVEGLVYNRSNLELDAFCERFARTKRSGQDVIAQVRDFVESSDGDFVVVVYEKDTNDLFVFNDYWARLSSYYYVDDELFVLSRNMGFILPWLPVIEVDRFALAEFFILEYSLGFKTLIRNVNRLPPASLVHARLLGSPQVQLERLAPVVFGGSASRISEDRAVAKCEELFLTSLRNRIERVRERGYRVTADVSGGYDTRAVAVGLAKLGVEAEFYTDAMDTSSESVVAQSLIEIYDKELRQICMSEPALDLSEMRRLAYITDGRIDCWTSQFVEHKAVARRLRVERPAARLMGFGGEFIRHPFKPPLLYRSLPEMMKDDVFSQHLDLAEACAVLDMDVAAMVDHLNAYFGGYPERDLRDQLKHFYFEYYSTLVNAGEDRHRRHFWTVQPLWGKDLVRFEMEELPLKLATFSFFRRFLGRLDERALAVPIYRKGVRRGSALSAVYMAIRPALKRVTYCKYVLKNGRRLERMLQRGRRAACDFRREYVLDNVESLGIPGSALNRGAVARLLTANARSDKVSILLTFVLYCEGIGRRIHARWRQGPRVAGG